jgi:hypothetical protein
MTASQPVRVQGAALAVAGIGIVVQMIAGVNYPAVPPGLVILLAAAAVVWFVPWRWAPLIGVLVGAFLVVGGFAAYQGRYDLSHPVTHPGAFAGTLLQMIAMAVSVAAGLVALAVRTQVLTSGRQS